MSDSVAGVPAMKSIAEHCCQSFDWSGAKRIVSSGPDTQGYRRILSNVHPDGDASSPKDLREAIR